MLTGFIYFVIRIEFRTNDPSLCSWHTHSLRSYTLYYDILNTTTAAATTKNYSPYTTGSIYNYDIHGNVKTLQQDYKVGLMNTKVERYKRTHYTYDLISGKVNTVSYQPNQYDQYYHRYAYDAENRLTDAYTTRRPEFVGSPLLEDRDAAYTYYKHGPMARTVLGQLNVQGIDYAYTIQGWLKGVNSTGVNTAAANRAAYDMGGDAGLNNTLPGGGLATALDAYSYQLNYYSADYTPINSTLTPFTTAHTALAAEYRPLYNGNISSMAVSIPVLTTPTQLYNYKYDQLNRIAAMNAYTGYTPASNTFTGLSLLTAYKEQISYDANGNILTYLRNGDAARTAMDNMTYSYTPGTNKLHKVADAAANTTAALYPNYNDIKTGQADNNYTYDEIGNLNKDLSEGIATIDWTVYGKIKTITKTATAGQTDRIDYTYDAAGNRISKFVHVSGQAATTGTYTWYARDASGNTMGVYTLSGATTLALNYSEAHVYGSSRLAVHNINITSAAPGYTTSTNATLGTITKMDYIRGSKFFELSNHLGNVLVTISDRKTPIDAGTYTYSSTTQTYTYINPTLDGNIDYYTAEVITANDYYVFGMAMPSRKYSLANGNYRYGFNGQMKSDEIGGDSYTALFWEYDARTGRRWNVDPEVKDAESPYMCFSGNPIFFSDILGNTPGAQQPGPKQPVPVNLSASQTSAAITSALFAVHTNTMEKRNYFVSSMAKESKQPLFDQDLYDTQPENVASLFGLKKEQVSEFAKVYKNYYNNFATIGMWFDGNSTIQELYKAMEQVSPDKQYKFANAFITDFIEKNAKWQQLSEAGVTFGNILLIYGGQQVKVGNGIKAPNILAANGKNLNAALSKVGGSKAASKFLGWGNKTTILKSASDFTKDQLIKGGYTKEVLLDIFSGLKNAAKKTLESTGKLNPASEARAEQVMQIIKTHF